MNLFFDYLNELLLSDNKGKNNFAPGDSNPIRHRCNRRFVHFFSSSERKEMNHSSTATILLSAL
jgi:hypothetical protein